MLTELLMQFAGLAGFEWLIIVGLVVVVFFGVKKIPEFARSFGRATGEYEKARVEAKREIQELKDQGSFARLKLESVASKLGLDFHNKTDDELRAAIDIELKKHKG